MASIDLNTASNLQRRRRGRVKPASDRGFPGEITVPVVGTAPRRPRRPRPLVRSGPGKSPLVPKPIPAGGGPSGKSRRPQPSPATGPRGKVAPPGGLPPGIAKKAAGLQSARTLAPGRMKNAAPATSSKAEAVGKRRPFPAPPKLGPKGKVQKPSKSAGRYTPRR